MYCCCSCKPSEEGIATLRIRVQSSEDYYPNVNVQCKSVGRENHDLQECRMAPALLSIANAKSLVYTSQGGLERKFRQKVMRCLKVNGIHTNQLLLDFIILVFRFRFWIWQFMSSVITQMQLAVKKKFVLLALESSLVFWMAIAVKTELICL